MEQSQPARRTTRLMITKMTLENFKSYAGAQEIGPFHKCFSSIVGPNGSGKSNVIDALLFVFGKRAKQLRLNKVSELIHKSSGFPDLESCSVEVHFQLIIDHDDHPDDFEVVPGSQFVVVRTAFGNNQSKYTVDSRTSSFAEVGQLLRGHGIDLDNNRFLILQGEVEQIAMMKPKAATAGEEGLLEYLEDIIGSNRFVEQIEERSKVLDGLNEQRTEKVNRLKIAERERDNLSGSKSEAEKFMEKEREIRRKKNTLYQIYEHSAAQTAEQHAAHKNKASENLVYEQSKKCESDVLLASMEKQYSKTLADYNAVCAETAMNNEQFAAFERRDVKLQEDKKYQTLQLKKLQDQVKKDSKKEEECRQSADATLVQIDKLKASVDDLRVRKVEEERAVDEIMNGMQEATAALREQLETANANLIAAERGIASLQTEKETVLMKLQLANSRVDAVTKQVFGCKEMLSKISTDCVVARSRSEVNRSEKEAAGRQIRELEALLLDCEKEEVRLHDQLRQATASAEEARASLAASGRGGDAIRSTIASITKAAKPGGPLASAGVRGRLGDLATIAPEYDVAISTACGMLDNVVVDTMEGAQLCVEFLKKHNLGRLTFIAVDQLDQPRRKMSVPFIAPDCSQRLFDLVQPLDPAFRAPLYRALGDCLVTSNLALATRIGLQGSTRYRVVTLDGKIVEPFGAMSGGGNSQKSGGMVITGSSSAKRTSAIASGAEVVDGMTPSDISALDAKVLALQTELGAIRCTKAETEKSIKDYQIRIKSLGSEAEKLGLSLLRWAEQETEICARIKTFQPELELSPAEAAEITAAREILASVDAKIQATSPNFNMLKNEVTLLQRKIHDVGGPKLAKAQAKIDIIANQLEQLSSALSTKTVEESTARKAAVKSAASRAKGEAELAKTEEKFTALISEHKEMEADALHVVTAVEQSKARMAEQEELLKTITIHFETVKKDVQKIRAIEVDLRDVIEESGRKQKESLDQATHWRKEVRAVQKLHVEDQREFLTTVRSILQDTKLVVSAIGVDSADSVGPSVSVGIETIEEEELLPTLSSERLAALLCDADEIKHELRVLETEREHLKGNVNMGALLEYMKKDAFYRSRLVELEVITEQRNNARREYEDLRRRRLEEFMGGFGTITLKLKEMYQMITLGGDAELELVDSLDPFSEGIVFSVRPPKKSWKNISNLSGGEKTLSSLALVFALHHYKPTPLYVMDEIDAALDFKNVSIVANYIKERTKNAQFVIISLR